MDVVELLCWVALWSWFVSSAGAGVAAALAQPRLGFPGDSVWGVVIGLVWPGLIVGGVFYVLTSRPDGKRPCSICLGRPQRDGQGDLVSCWKCGRSHG